MPSPAANPERVRLDDCARKDIPSKKWGPYFSERQWGTLREDYSYNGAAWDYFPHDQARARLSLQTPSRPHRQYFPAGSAGLCWMPLALHLQ